MLCNDTVLDTVRRLELPSQMTGTRMTQSGIITHLLSVSFSAQHSQRRGKNGIVSSLCVRLPGAVRREALL